MTGSYHDLHEEEQKEGIGEEELVVESVSKVWPSGMWTRNAGEDSDRCLELRVDVVVLFGLTMLAEVCLFHGFYHKVFFH